jgi:hypothetical protein
MFAFFPFGPFFFSASGSFEPIGVKSGVHKVSIVLSRLTCAHSELPRRRYREKADEYTGEAIGCAVAFSFCSIDVLLRFNLGQLISFTFKSILVFRLLDPFFIQIAVFVLFVNSHFFGYNFHFRSHHLSGRLVANSI